MSDVTAVLMLYFIIQGSDTSDFKGPASTGCQRNKLF